jgi:hypothetical protein
VKLRPDCGRLPWLTALVGIVGIVARFWLPSPASLAWSDAWQMYVVGGSTILLLLVLAELGWQCHRQRLAANMPPDSILVLLGHLAEKGGWAGAPAAFNRDAVVLLYGDYFASMLQDSTDYWSALLAQGLLRVTSASDIGNKPDGTVLSTVTLDLTEKAHEILVRARQR